MKPPALILRPVIAPDAVSVFTDVLPAVTVPTTVKLSPATILLPTYTLPVTPAPPTTLRAPV